MSEEDRARLYSWLCEQTDEPLAEYLMSCLAPAPLLDLVTKDFLRSELEKYPTKDEVAARFAAFGDRMEAKFDQLAVQRDADRREFAAQREADRAELAVQREADRAEFAAQREADRAEVKNQCRWGLWCRS
ncbi:hypothetical protein [Candidatus Poriferisodalis sp.]|uniref:hypothetical protein n=1 Tax=Candidatus Poriferisodalis sp. TaxID=3101277 RepID=UPI003B020383